MERDDLLQRYEALAGCTIEESIARPKSAEEIQAIALATTNTTTRFPGLDPLTARFQNLM